ncbi:MAG: permease [Pseudomonadota bacterium]
MQRTLSFELAPALKAVARYFLSAPLFAIAAGLLMLVAGEDAFASRWSPATLALTHLFTLGILSMSMIGALIHIMPVVAGMPLPHVDTGAPLVHALLCAGTLALAGAFWFAQGWLFGLALALLLVAFGLLLLACALALRRAAPAAAHTVAALRLALGALALTVVLGALLGGALAWPALLRLDVVALTNVHALWGLAGWVGLLIIGVAYQVIPMFQVTPPYPKRFARALAPALVVAVLARSARGTIGGSGAHGLAALLDVALPCGYLVFACATLWLLSRRKRPPDPTTWFWRVSMASLIACMVLVLLPGPMGGEARPLLLGVLFVMGFAVSAINGMLYKIVPFLVWYHLQSSAVGAMHLVPGVKRILPDLLATWQFRAHCAALAMLLAAALDPPLWARPAALALCLSAAFLLHNVLHALRIYAKLSLLGGTKGI